MKRFAVLGTPLEATTYADFTSHCQQLCQADRPIAVDLSNTQIVTKRRHEPLFREITSKIDYFVPDGMPLIWCLNRAGARLSDRVYGPAFMRECVLNSPKPFTHFFLGASSECLEKLKQNFLQQNSELQIVGCHHGYFSEAEDEQIVAEINRLSPDFIWIGLGTPKQQAWIHRNKEHIHRGVLLAVGFAFDVNAGTKPDAPDWMQRCGLTWVYRTVSEPRRLLMRYLRYNSLFLFYLCWDALRRCAVKRVS
jgi:N-acetylglucosaminyldiphosphoundecaprenol N-acetyl-beta-D-mannosaminyltransferase